MIIYSTFSCQQNETTKCHTHKYAERSHVLDGLNKEKQSGVYKVDLKFYSAGITCDAPPAGDNTEPIPAELAMSGLDYLETYTYSCLAGFGTTDDLCVVCMPDGTLSMDTAPNCTCE